MEKYLIEIQNVKQCQAVTKLRISAHILPVETGRYKNIPYCDRVCRHCDLNEVGDEQHYVTSCRNTMFATSRQDFIDDLYKINHSFIFFKLEDLFHYVMAMHDTSIMRRLSEYCYDILSVFDEIQL